MRLTNRYMMMRIALSSQKEEHTTTWIWWSSLVAIAISNAVLFYVAIRSYYKAAAAISLNTDYAESAGSFLTELCFGFLLHIFVSYFLVIFRVLSSLFAF